MKRLALFSFSLCLTPLALAEPPAPDERTAGTTEQREAAAQDTPEEEDDTITSYHFGSTKIFSSPDLIPNRFGFSLESVTLLEREDGSLEVDFN